MELQRRIIFKIEPPIEPSATPSFFRPKLFQYPNFYKEPNFLTNFFFCAQKWFLPPKIFFWKKNSDPLLDHYFKFFTSSPACKQMFNS